MIQKVRCIDATAKQMAIISNGILKKSSKFAQEAYAKDLITSKAAKLLILFTSKKLLSQVFSQISIRRKND